MVKRYTDRLRIGKMILANDVSPSSELRQRVLNELPNVRTLIKQRTDWLAEFLQWRNSPISPDNCYRILVTSSNNVADLLDRIQEVPSKLNAHLKTC